ncbi:MAG TPA: hypothetical protein VGM98_20500 [Schlesneria sp.]
MSSDNHFGVWILIDENSSFRWEYGYGYAPYSCYGGRPLAKGRVPQWASTTPLTLLSAYLILWKPRKRA